MSVHARSRLRPASLLAVSLLLGTLPSAVTPQTAARPAVSDRYPRDESVDILRYLFALRLSDSSDRIEGSADVTVRFLRPEARTFSLDLVGRTPASGDTGMAVLGVWEGEEEIPWQHDADRLQVRVSDRMRVVADHTITIRYEGIPRDGLIISRNRHGQRTFFGDNWPDRARHWLPAIDHPYDKAAVEFTVTAPAVYQVVANGRLIEETDLPSGDRRTRWREDAPLPTKVMVIGVARFAVDHLPAAAGVPQQSWVYPEDREAGFHDFAQGPPIMTWFSEHIGPFPYAKLANVQSSTRYGGMENAGCIFYSERSIRGDRSNESLMAHEIAHQWFGDSISEEDWHHIWLSEGFATYFAQLYLEGTYGRTRLEEGMRSSRSAVLRFAAADPTASIVDERITDLNDLLNTNSYQKGSWVLHMLRSLIGEEAFWMGIREFYASHRDGNVLTADLQAVMERTSGHELGWFFDQWVFGPDIPRLRGTWHFDPERRQTILELEQIQRTAALFRFPLEIGIVDTEGFAMRVQVVEVRERSGRFALRTDHAPFRVVLDPNTLLLFDAEFGPREGGVNR